MTRASRLSRRRRHYRRGVCASVMACALLSLSLPTLAEDAVLPSRSFTPAEPQQDCYDLSQEVTELLASRPPGSNGYWQQDANRGAAATALFAPISSAIHLGHRVYWAARGDMANSASDQRVRELRTLMARQQCFVK